jgi:hypothetical protein
MPSRFTRADVVETPLPSDFGDQPCLPLVVMQPAADLSDYMFKSVFATNGQPGTVDRALTAINALNLPKHGLQHLASGNDAIPLANVSSDGLCPQGTGAPSDYLGGDMVFHSQSSGLMFLRSEGKCTVSAGAAAGATLFTGTVPNPVSGIYIPDMIYLYDASQSPAPAGTVHFDVYDVNSSSWIAASASTDLSVLNAITALCRPILTSGALIRTFQAAPNSLTWRMVLDTPGLVQFTVQVGFKFFVGAIQTY